MNYFIDGKKLSQSIRKTLYGEEKVTFLQTIDLLRNLLVCALAISLIPSDWVLYQMGNLVNSLEGKTTLNTVYHFRITEVFVSVLPAVMMIALVVLVKRVLERCRLDISEERKFGGNEDFRVFAEHINQKISSFDQIFFYVAITIFMVSSVATMGKRGDYVGYFGIPTDARIFLTLALSSRVATIISSILLIYREEDTSLDSVKKEIGEDVTAGKSNAVKKAVKTLLNEIPSKGEVKQ